ASERNTAATAAVQPSTSSADEVQQLQQRRDELQRTVTDLERQRDELQVNLNEEDKAGGIDKQKGGRRPAGEGSNRHESYTTLTAVKAQLEERRRALEGVKRELQNLQQAGITAQKNAEAAAAAAAADRGVKAAQLEQAEAEIKDLTLKVKDAE